MASTHLLFIIFFFLLLSKRIKNPISFEEMGQERIGSRRMLRPGRCSSPGVDLVYPLASLHEFHNIPIGVFDHGDAHPWAGLLFGQGEFDSFALEF